MVTVDLAAPAFRADPHGEWRQLRAHGAVHRERGGAWLVVRHEDVARLLHDERLNKDLRPSGAYNQDRPYGGGSLVETYVEAWMHSRLPDRLARWRRAVSRALAAETPRLRMRTAELVRELIEELPPDRPFDLIECLASPLPMRVLVDAMRLPPERAGQFERWSGAISLVLEPDAPAPARREGEAALAAVVAVLEAEVASLRRSGRDTLTARLMAQDDLDDGELVATLLLLFLSAHETSASLIGNGLLALLRHPGSLQCLTTNDPALMQRAIDELVRYDGPAALVLRAARRPIAIGDVTVAAGELVLLSLASANRDEGIFVDSNRLDLGRRTNPHLGFGAGAHSCLGMTLARLEAAAALQAIARRWPALRHEEASLRWKPTALLRSIARMRVAAHHDILGGA